MTAPRKAAPTSVAGDGQPRLAAGGQAGGHEADGADDRGDEVEGRRELLRPAGVRRLDLDDRSSGRSRSWPPPGPCAGRARPAGPTPRRPCGRSTPPGRHAVASATPAAATSRTGRRVEQRPRRRPRRRPSARKTPREQPAVAEADLTVAGGDPAGRTGHRWPTAAARWRRRGGSRATEVRRPSPAPATLARRCTAEPSLVTPGRLCALAARPACCRRVRHRPTSAASTDDRARRRRRAAATRRRGRRRASSSALETRRAGRRSPPPTTITRKLGPSTTDGHRGAGRLATVGHGRRRALRRRAPSADRRARCRSNACEDGTLDAADQRLLGVGSAFYGAEPGPGAAGRLQPPQRPTRRQPTSTIAGQSRPRASTCPSAPAREPYCAHRRRPVAALGHRRRRRRAHRSSQTPWPTAGPRRPLAADASPSPAPSASPRRLRPRRRRARGRRGSWRRDRPSVATTMSSRRMPHRPGGRCPARR